MTMGVMLDIIATCKCGKTETWEMEARWFDAKRYWEQDLGGWIIGEYCEGDVECPKCADKRYKKEEAEWAAEQKKSGSTSTSTTS